MFRAAARYPSGYGHGMVWCIGFGAIFAVFVFALGYQSHLAQEAAKKRLEELARRFGPEIAKRIVAGEIWQGQTGEQLVEALGFPADHEEKVLKTKVKRTLKYDQRSAKAFGLRVFLEDDVVVGWERK